MTIYRVFSQAAEPRNLPDEWTRAAKRFFGVDLDLTARTVTARLREDSDLRDALEAEQRTGFTGLYDLAERRCPTVFEVERRSDDDKIALQLAAILATVGLGPILAEGELFGVRTARLKLSETRSP
jgi:hypothetical protein